MTTTDTTKTIEHALNLGEAGQHDDQHAIGVEYISALRRQMSGEALSDVEARAFFTNATQVRDQLHSDESVDVRAMVDEHQRIVTEFDKLQSAIDWKKHHKQVKQLRAAFQKAGDEYEKACAAVDTAEDRDQRLVARGNMNIARDTLEEAKAPFVSSVFDTGYAVASIGDEPVTSQTNSIRRLRQLNEKHGDLVNLIEAADKNSERKNK